MQPRGGFDGLRIASGVPRMLRMEKVEDIARKNSVCTASWWGKRMEQCEYARCCCQNDGVFATKGGNR
jgi:hypothetical protein